jgi:hypothetical protein
MYVILIFLEKRQFAEYCDHNIDPRVTILGDLEFDGNRVGACMYTVKENVNYTYICVHTYCQSRDLPRVGKLCCSD